MRCKKHFTDLSSNVGVCASCLRERLFPLVHETLDEQNHNSETHTVFPRSVSPYKSNQNNTDRNHHHHSLPDIRFFSTPDVAPVTGSYNSCRKKKQRLFSFSLLSNLFRSKKSNKRDTDPIPNPNPRSSVCGDDTATSATSSPFRFSQIRSSGGILSKQQLGFNDVSTGVIRNKQYCSDRGMSPVRNVDCDGAEDEIFDRSSGYETCESRKQTPWRTPAHRRGGGSGGGGERNNVSVMSFCLSPLVRASPCRNRNPKGVVPLDYGEIGGAVKAQRCKVESFCGNRSRKVADFGRVATNR